MTRRTRRKRNRKSTFDLLYEAREGSELAKEELIVKLEPMLRKLARELLKAHVSPAIDEDDLVQEGRLSVCESIRDFADTGAYGKNFVSYANKFAFWRMCRYIETNGFLVVRLPNYLFHALRDLDKTVESDTITAADIDKDYCRDIDNIVNAYNWFWDKDYEPLTDEDCQAYSIAADDDVEETVCDHLMAEVLRTTMKENLRDSYREVLEMIYGFTTGEEMTYQQVANELGITRARVGQKHNVALEKLSSVGLVCVPKWNKFCVANASEKGA